MSVEWVADTLIPLVATLIGVIIAVALVRHQLEADRRLRNADRAIEHISPLTAALRDSVDRLNKQPADEYWHSPDWPDEAKLSSELVRAVAYLTPASRQTLTRLTGTIAVVWHRASKNPNGFRSTHSEALRLTIAPLVAALGEAVTALEGWSGSGGQPPLAPTRRKTLDKTVEDWLGDYEQIASERRAPATGHIKGEGDGQA